MLQVSRFPVYADAMATNVVSQHVQTLGVSEESDGSVFVWILEGRDMPYVQKRFRIVGLGEPFKGPAIHVGRFGMSHLFEEVI